MSSNQIIAYRALRKTLPPQIALYFARNRRFAVANRALLPVLRINTRFPILPYGSAY